jgi:hypothetical protein
LRRLSAKTGEIQVKDDIADQFDLIFRILEWLCGKTYAMFETDQDYYKLCSEIFKIKEPANQEILSNLYEKSRPTLQVEGKGCHVYLPPLWKKSDIVPLL